MGSSSCCMYSIVCRVIDQVYSRERDWFGLVWFGLVWPGFLEKGKNQHTTDWS